MDATGYVLLFLPESVVALSCLSVATLLLVRSRRFRDGVKVSQAVAWAILGSVYVFIDITGLPLDDPLRPELIRGALFLLIFSEILNQFVMLFYGRHRDGPR